jgi:hypothetical protein
MVLPGLISEEQEEKREACLIRTTNLSLALGSERGNGEHAHMSKAICTIK